MKNLPIVALVAFAAFSLAGCSKSFCDSQKDSYDSALKKVTDCATMKAAMESSRPSDANCEATYAKCTEADKTVLDDMVACLEALPTCTKDTELTTWAAAALACQTKANSLSSGCIAIMNP